MNLVRRFYQEREGLRRTVRELARRPGALMLDVGCRKGEITRTFAVGKRFTVALDIRQHADWSDPTPDLSFVAGNAAVLPFESASFDILVSSECLQYVADWRGALDEFHRVLKPGGLLVLSCPNGTPLTNGLDPYNLAYRVKRLLGRSATSGYVSVKHHPTRRILEHCRDGWECEEFLRRGSLLFIHAAFAIDNLQGLRVRLLRRGGAAARRFAEWGLKPALVALFRVMQSDFALPLSGLSYNVVYRFRKRPVTAASPVVRP